MSGPRPWTSPGPVSSAFLGTEAPVSVLMGPAAGGKTVTSLQRGVLRAFSWPETEPGWRRVRFLVMRQRMTDMEGSTLPSWFSWYPRSLGNFVGKEGSPKRHSLTLAHPAGGKVALEVHFRGIGEQSVDDALRGFEFSYAYVDECDLMDGDVMASLVKRSGRFPPETLARNPRQVWGSCNAPAPDSWVVRDMMDEPLPGWVLYRQPSGLSPQAENLAVLGENYYREQAAVLPEYERKRFVENIPGLLREASAVYHEFNPSLHVSDKPLLPLPGRPLLVGMDAGGTPAAACVQIAADGQRRVLAELSTHGKEGGSITGPQRFGEALARLIQERFQGLAVRALADPSAAWGADRAAGEGSWIDIVGRASGLRVHPAPTNDPTIRTEALRWPMQQLIDGRKPGLLVCPSCTLTGRALARDYRFTVTAGRRSERPMKNWASHLVEALQYALMDGSAFYEITARQQQRRQAAAPVVANTAFNPFQQETRPWR